MTWGLTNVVVFGTVPHVMTNGAHTPHPEAKATAKDRLLQTIAVLGLIAILLLGAWGIIQLAFNLPGIFSNLGGSLSGVFNGSATSTLQVRESVSVTAPAVVTTGQPFSIQWRHIGGTGSFGYTVHYSCAEGVSLKAPLPNGTYQTVECNTPFNFTNAKDKMTLQPTVTAAAPAKITFTVSAVRLSNNQVVVSGTASSTLQKSAVKTTSSGTYTASSAKKTLSGSPDLLVQINSVTPAGYGRSNVTFTIMNIGSNVAYAGWTFDVELPTSRGYTYNSAPQQPLYPGDRIVYNLGFENENDRDDRDYDRDDSRRNYDGEIVITVDPGNYVREANEWNNTASVR